MSKDVRRCAAALAVVGVAIGTLVLSQFPQCLADPYANLDPRLKTYWLDYIVEAQSMFDILKNEPEKVLAWYVTPLIALAILAFRAIRTGLSRGETILALALVGAFATSVWQLRGGTFAVPLATAALAGWVTRHRTTNGSIRANLISVSTWLLSINVVWVGLAMAFTPDAADKSQANGAQGAVTAPSECYAVADYAQLAALPAGTVLGVSNLGSGVITYTHHRALAGPYHRNVAGNLAVLDTLLAEPQAARQAAIRSGATLLAVCRGNPETAILAKHAPGSLIAGLAKGDAPYWLRRVAGSADGMEIYEISPQPGP